MSSEMTGTAPKAALAAALAKANAEIHNPSFDKENPHFRSKFASLAAVRNALVPIYAKHGLSIIQDLQTTSEGAVACYTTLMHASGDEKTFGPLVIKPSKPDAQGIGTAGTYAKRIALQGVACVVGDDDDDGETAVGRDTGSKDIGKPRGVTTVDPRGDVKPQDEKAVNGYAKRFRDAMEADKEEAAIAADVFAIHTEVMADHDLYIAIGDALGSKLKNALRKYVEIHKKAQRQAA